LDNWWKFKTARIWFQEQELKLAALAFGGYGPTNQQQKNMMEQLGHQILLV
jgi:hypothetical protein